MNLNTLEVLRAARDLLADPLCWTQGEYATDASGVPTGVESRDACKFCSIGALIRVTSWDGEYQKAYEILTDVVGKRVADFNDCATHEQVLSAFDAAIAKAEAA